MAYSVAMRSWPRTQSFWNIIQGSQLLVHTDFVWAFDPGTVDDTFYE